MGGIVSWGAYVPHYRITVDEVAAAQNKEAIHIKNGLRISEKSVPGIDEDTATIAVAAARMAVSVVSREKIGAIYIGSESHPYAVKPTGTIVGEALDIGNTYTTADFEFACKGGTAALQAGLAMVRSNMAELSLVGGCDCAQAAPGDALEFTAGAGGAVFVVGKEDVVADINHTTSFTSDTPDFWRRKEQKYPSHGGAFTGEPAYFKHILAATKNLMEQADTTPHDYTHFVAHQPNGKFPVRIGKRLGFSLDQLQKGLLVDKIGNTYSAASLLGLISVLESANPGDRILLTSYGSGAGSDSFDLTVTDNITEIQTKLPKLHSMIGEKTYVNYHRYRLHQ